MVNFADLQVRKIFCDFADLNTESRSFWTKTTIECLRDISDGMTSVECRHTNFSSYVQI